MGIDTTVPPVSTSTSATVSPNPVLMAHKKHATRGVVTIEVTSPVDAVDSGTVEVYDGATLLGTTTVSDHGVATFTLPAYKHKGVHRLRVRYLGTPSFQPSQTCVRFRVSNK